MGYNGQDIIVRFDAKWGSELEELLRSELSPQKFAVERINQPNSLIFCLRVTYKKYEYGSVPSPFTKAEYDELAPYLPVTLDSKPITPSERYGELRFRPSGQ